MCQGIIKREWEASVAAGTLPQIEPEVAQPEAPNSSTTRQSSRAPRTRDVAPPLTPSIRLPKKATTSTPSVSRTATLTPAPQQVAAPQNQPVLQHTPAPQQLLAPQPIPAVMLAQRPLQPHVPPVQPVPAPAPAPAPVEVEEDTTAGLVRDKQSDELVQQLEAAFPRYPGPGAEGWMVLPENVDVTEKYLAILNEIREFKDAG
jgi:hypothetical protein